MDADKLTMLQLIAHYRHELGYGVTAATIAACVHIQRKESAREVMVEAVMAGIVGGAAERMLELFQMKDAGFWAYALACTIGYFGVRTLFDRLGDKFGLKG